MEENSKVSGIVHAFIHGKVIIFLSSGRIDRQIAAWNFLNGSVLV